MRVGASAPVQAVRPDEIMGEPKLAGSLFARGQDASRCSSGRASAGVEAWSGAPPPFVRARAPFLRVGGCAFAGIVGTGALSRRWAVRADVLPRGSRRTGRQANCRKPYKRMRFREARDLGGARFRCFCESAHAGYACESMLARLSRASVSFGAGCCSSPSGRPAVRSLQPPRQVRFAANCTGASFLCRGSYKIADFPSSFLPPYL